MKDLSFYLNKISAYTESGVDFEKIEEYQDKLGFAFPDEYLNFVRRYGYLEYEGRVILGVSDSEETTYDVTTDLREKVSSFPSNMIVIEALGIDNRFILLDDKGVVYEYDLVSLKKIYSSFETFVICDILNAEMEDIATRLIAVCELLIEAYDYHKEWANHLYKRISKLYGPVMEICYQFENKELDIIEKEIFQVEYRLLNNSLQTVQEFDHYTQKDYLLCYLDIASVLNGFDFSYVNKYIKYVVSNINPSNQENNELQQKLLAILIFNDSKEEEKLMEETKQLENEGGEKVIPTPSDDNAVLEKLEVLQQAMQALQECFDSKIATDAHKNGLFDNMHKELTRYQNGAMDKIVDTIALDIIQLVDTTKGHLRVYEKKEPNEENYKRLLRIIKGVTEDLQDILYRQSIEAYRVEGHEVDVRRQKIIQTIPTDDQSKDNLVAVRAADGYEKDGKVLRPERIKIFKYSTEATNNSDEN